MTKVIDTGFPNINVCFKVETNQIVDKAGKSPYDEPELRQKLTQYMSENNLIILQVPCKQNIQVQMVVRVDSCQIEFPKEIFEFVTICLGYFQTEFENSQTNYSPDTSDKSQSQLANTDDDVLRAFTSHIQQSVQY